MKLASLKHGRDGILVVVSRDLKRAVKVPSIAATMQQALDAWAQCEPELRAVAQKLEAGDVADAFDFDPEQCASPLPRAYQWADGSAYLNHVELVRRARGAKVPDTFFEDPLMYQGGSDSFIGPRDRIVVPSTEFGLDFEAEVTVVTDDVPMGVSPETALGHIKLVMLVNDVSLRGLIPGELGKGFGFFQSKPASAFSPVAVTPDEFEDAWSGGKLNHALVTHYNGELFGRPNAGEDMTFHFGRLVAHAARTRELEAGTIVGSGTVSNKQGTEHGTSISEGGVGYSCIAELRCIETIRNGSATTTFMGHGDRVRIEMFDAQERSIFGAIDHVVDVVEPTA
ncbi:MAG: fumarylacetoacetate hydrolase family protein [Myxococcota bacterium]